MEIKSNSIPENVQKSERKPFKIENESLRLTNEDGWLDILGSNDLKKQVIKTGEGVDSRPQRGDWISISGFGKLENGDIVEKFDNLKIILGDSDVAQGLDLALALMEKDETAEIVVPSRLAYGKQGKLPEIPPDSVINYEIELVDVIPESDELTLVQKQQTGKQKRERGNFWYARGEYSTAVHCYRRALEYLDCETRDCEESESDIQELLNERLKVFNNLAAAQMKMDAYEAAMKSINTVLASQPNNVKALFRKGKILTETGNLDDAVSCLKNALKIEPESKIIYQELFKLTNKKHREEAQAKTMYKKMFKYMDFKSQSKSTNKKSFLSKFQHWSIIVTSILTVLCGIVLYKKLQTSE